MLRDGRIDKVTLLYRNLNEDARIISRKTTRGDSCLGLNEVILTFRVGSLEYQGQDPLSLIGLQVESPHERDTDNDDRRDREKEIPVLKSPYKEDTYKAEYDYHRSTKVGLRKDKEQRDDLDQ